MARVSANCRKFSLGRCRFELFFRHRQWGARRWKDETFQMVSPHKSQYRGVVGRQRLQWPKRKHRECLRRAEDAPTIQGKKIKWLARPFGKVLNQKVRSSSGAATSLFHTHIRTQAPSPTHPYQLYVYISRSSEPRVFRVPPVFRGSVYAPGLSPHQALTDDSI